MVLTAGWLAGWLGGWPVGIRGPLLASVVCRGSLSQAFSAAQDQQALMC